MLKTIGFSAIALLGMLAIAPRQAKAEERFGVPVDRPAYAYRVHPEYSRERVAVVPAPFVAGRAWVRRDMRWDRRHDSRFRR